MDWEWVRVLGGAFVGAVLIYGSFILYLIRQHKYEDGFVDEDGTIHDPPE